MADQPKQTSKPVRFFKGLLQVVGFLTILFGGVGGVGNLLGLEAVGPAAATAMLNAFGDPCVGVEHPRYRSDARGQIVDGVQEYQDVQTDIIYVVEKAAVKNGWAYIETAPVTSGEPEAFLLEARNVRWVVRWTGKVGAQPGSGPRGNPYPDDFDASNQSILRCPDNCAVDS